MVAFLVLWSHRLTWEQASNRYYVSVSDLDERTQAGRATEGPSTLASIEEAAGT
jgi:hypothetical protein